MDDIDIIFYVITISLTFGTIKGSIRNDCHGLGLSSSSTTTTRDEQAVTESHQYLYPQLHQLWPESARRGLVHLPKARSPRPPGQHHEGAAVAAFGAPADRRMRANKRAISAELQRNARVCRQESKGK